MKEIVSIEINNKSVIIGYSSMYFPTNKREQEQNHVFKSLRLKPKDSGQEGDVFFFHCKKLFKNEEWIDEWFLIPEFGFICNESPVIDLYMNSCFDNNTTFDQFVEAVFREHYWEN